ncbi:hypothetical protein BLL42_27430 (plasmid) [Pseudomonas frederiksbergensis]|uniref:Uncharacterized protein n=1 Tax=Pseudomonas frederiksbergensis TaxID=104087 RepID=A0A1J0ETI3_9PSED|nr:hypothetical protein [Pseudomonas frederiksbergensis]APC19469.1 hypothetical protein BLL42_27430 [Pseudomonas frederiksbergensis]
MVNSKKTEIWIHSYNAEGGLRHASKVHPRAFNSVNTKDLQYRRWLQELLRGAPESPLALYIKCTRFVDLAKTEHREKALTPLPFVFLHYLRESRGWTVPQPGLPVLNLIAFDWQTAGGSQMVIPHSVQSSKALDQIEVAGLLTEIFEDLKSARPDLLPKTLAETA